MGRMNKDRGGSEEKGREDGRRERELTRDHKRGDKEEMVRTKHEKSVGVKVGEGRQSGTTKGRGGYSPKLAERTKREKGE